MPASFGRLLLVFLLGMLPAHSFATSTPTAAGIVMQAIKASGGVEKLRAFQQVEWRGRARVYRGEQPSIVLQGHWQLEMPGRYQVKTTDQQGRERTMIVSARGGRTIISGQEKPMEKAMWQEEREQFYLYWLATLLPLQEPATRLRVQTTSKDTALYQVVEAQRTGYAPVVLYFDRYTHLLVRLKSPRPGPDGKAVTQIMQLGSYQPVRGCYRPFHIRLTQNQQLYFDLRIEKMSSQGQAVDNATTFAYQRQPLQVQVDSSFVRGEVRAERIVYSDKGQTKTSAWRVRPAASGGRHAGLLYIHWGGGNKDEFLEEALEMGRRGFVSLLLDAPFAKSFAPERDLIKDALPIYREGFLDMLRGVDLLQADPAVDSTRLYVVGHSYGAHLGGALAGLRPGAIRGCVLMAGSAAITRSTELSGGFWARLRRQKPAEFRQFVLSQEPLDAWHFLAEARAPLLLQYGQQDEYDIGESEARQYAELWPAGLSETRGYQAKHKMDSPEARQDRIDWLSRLEGR